MKKPFVITLSKEEFRKIVREEATKAMNSKKPIKKKMIRSIGGLAEFLRVSRPTATKMLDQKVISGFKDGRTYIFDPEIIHNQLFLNKNQN